MLMKAARANVTPALHLGEDEYLKISRQMWAIGDWLNYGERRYGEMYAQAVDATGYENGTLRDAKWVSGAYELSIRIYNLSFAHHRIVCSGRQFEL